MIPQIPNAPKPKRTHCTQEEIWGIQPMRFSSHAWNLTQQLIQSKEYEEREREVNEEGEKWANDEEHELLPEFDEEAPAANNTKAPVIEPDNTWVPTSHDEAMTHPDLWMPPMEKELAKLDSHKAFTPVHRPKDVKTITMGYDQVKGIHYEDTWSIVARYESEQFAIAIAAYEGLDLWSGDFTGAYLNAKPQDVNYLKLPEGFESQYSLRDREETVLLMNINIYGTMDADPCVQYRQTETGYTFTVTYTDDVTGVSLTKEDGERVRKEIAEGYEFRDYGRPDVILGMTVRKDEVSGSISIHQRPLIEKTLERFGMQDCAPKYTPLSPGIKFINSQPDPIPANDKLFMIDKNYYSLVGALNHISQGTQPDISFSVSLL
ncbi:hypothetical protein D9758_016061 [Tetrapyrgos nigripes]|uniref:Reverse transcriptase Ty1/copia-type domain-containing protein n=1 Tax=Tetrapyrgos nigripes TaxID=182062 RepID=A0A8H5C6R6_9AGAR|nr:hypothetical protein D9758_016061 [Tetrapyrgos nigripes]